MVGKRPHTLANIGGVLLIWLEKDPIPWQILVE